MQYGHSADILEIRFNLGMKLGKRDLNLCGLA